MAPPHVPAKPERLAARYSVGTTFHPAGFREPSMRQLLAGLVVAATLVGGGLAPAAAGPHGCYSSHCGKH